MPQLAADVDILYLLLLGIVSPWFARCLGLFPHGCLSSCLWSCVFLLLAAGSRVAGRLFLFRLELFGRGGNDLWVLGAGLSAPHLLISIRWRRKSAQRPQAVCLLRQVPRP